MVWVGSRRNVRECRGKGQKMGGYGSNRWGGEQVRATTGESFALSVAAVRPYLGEGNRAVGWTWSTNGKPMASVRAVVSREEVLLWYTVTCAGGEPEPVQDVLPLVWTACTYGGMRPWFVCAQCATRRQVLYLPLTGTRFRCRECHELSYSSQRMDAVARATERVRAVERRMGGEGKGALFAAPPRPKGMHARTYERLRNELWERQMRRDEILAHELAALVKRFDRIVKR